MNEPCDGCPWRRANHGRRQPRGVHTQGNIQRLWNEIRNGKRTMTCNDAKPDENRNKNGPTAAPECTGSVILVMREVLYIAALGKSPGVMEPDDVEEYLKEHTKSRNGLTKKGIYDTVLRRLMPKGLLNPDTKPMPTPTAEQIGNQAYGRPNGP